MQGFGKICARFERHAGKTAVCSRKDNLQDLPIVGIFGPCFASNRPSGERIGGRANRAANGLGAGESGANGLRGGLGKKSVFL